MTTTQQSTLSRMGTIELPWYLSVSALVATVLTIFDGAFTYWIVGQGLGREANPILTTFVSWYETQGMSHMEAFGMVMFWRVVIGVFMVMLLATTATYRLAIGKENWVTKGALPFVAGTLILLTMYHIIGYYLVFQYR